jgi:hypothetical protein
MAARYVYARLGDYRWTNILIANERVQFEAQPNLPKNEMHSRFFSICRLAPSCHPLEILGRPELLVLPIRPALELSPLPFHSGAP